jgi:hypothetical protein
MSMVFYFVSNTCLSWFNYYSIPWLNGNLASGEKYSGPLRFRLRQVLLYKATALSLWPQLTKQQSIATVDAVFRHSGKTMLWSVCTAQPKDCGETLTSMILTRISSHLGSKMINQREKLQLQWINTEICKSGLTVEKH